MTVQWKNNKNTDMVTQTVELTDINQVIIHILEAINRDYKHMISKIETSLNERSVVVYQLENIPKDRRTERYLTKIYKEKYKNKSDCQRMLNDASNAINILEEEKIELQEEILRLRNEINCLKTEAEANGKQRP